MTVTDETLEEAPAIGTLPARDWAQRQLAGSLRYQTVAWLTTVGDECKLPEEWAADFQAWSNAN